jgi:hypothetical protein
MFSPLFIKTSEKQLENHTMKSLLLVLVIAGLAAGAYFFLLEQENSRQRAKQRTNSAISLTKQHLKELQLALKEISIAIAVGKGTRSGIFPGSMDELTREQYGYFEPLSQGAFRTMSTDGWGQTMHYRAEQGKFYVGEEESTMIYSTSHYELYSGGPDGIPGTSDDIQSWHIPGHQRGSIESLASRWSRERNEASKSTLDKLIEKIR